LSQAGREALLAAYGVIGDERLLRARVLSVFLNATLAIYGHAERLRGLECEAIVGLHRTLVD
jgi:hypothetical protein